MTETPDDTFRDLNELIRNLLERSCKADGMPPFGHAFRIVIRNDEGRVIPPGPVTQEGERVTVLEPEIHATDTEVFVVAEIPGCEERDLAITLRDRHLTVSGKRADAVCRCTAVLPPVDAGSMHHTFRNGVLEVAFSLRQPASGASVSTG
jgi:HSP20 family molecular chaperone IbpA